MTKENLNLKVYRDIKKRLISLQYPPGSYIQEREVAETFGVSKTPVREAFLRLSHEGWLNIGNRKKIQVRPVAMLDIEEIFEIRNLVEPFSFKWVLQNGEPRAIAGQTDSILNSMMQTPDDKFSFTQLDLQFHSIVISCSGYERINRFWTTVHEEAVRLGFMAMHGSYRFSEVLKEHTAIVEALWNKDEKAVLEAVDTHLRNTKIALMSRLGVQPSQETDIISFNDPIRDVASISAAK